MRAVTVAHTPVLPDTKGNATRGDLRARRRKRTTNQRMMKTVKEKVRTLDTHPKSSYHAWLGKHDAMREGTCTNA